MKAAYFCLPHVSGTFTFFELLRPALRAHDIELRCVSLHPAERFAGTRFAGRDDVDYLSLPEDLAAATGQVIEYLLKEHYDLTISIPNNLLLAANLPRYLPRSIRSAMRVPMMTRGGYAPTAAVASHLNGILSISDRITDDMRRGYKIPDWQLHTIFHGIDPALFPDSLRPKTPSGPLRMAFAGRLSDADKGIFLFPAMLQHLKQRGVRFHMTIVGSGPDGETLSKRLHHAGVMDSVTMTGALPLPKVFDQLRHADVFIFPSRYEGCGFAVLEAMAAGCAPVASNIRGSLAAIVEDGVSGNLCRVGDAVAFATAIAKLDADRALLARLQAGAQARIQSRFTLERMVASYAEAFRQIVTGPDRRPPPLDLARYDIPSALQPGWRTRIPMPVKKFARTWLERFGFSA